MIGFDFADIKGQVPAKRALEIAVAGGHNVLMVGAPGSARLMLARRIPGILPPLSEEEAVETAAIHAAAGFPVNREENNRRRPFRAPHHTVSRAGMVGGGQFLRPGEASLAHHGVLFLDDLPEFQRTVLAALRQIMKAGEAGIHRNGQETTFPARFLLAAAMNPCPCGCYGQDRCHCDAETVLRHLNRAQDLNCFDIIIRVPSLAYRDFCRAAVESSAAARERVCAARAFAARQPDRKAPSTGKVSRVARTIADLAGSLAIRPEHLTEARTLTNPF